VRFTFSASVASGEVQISVVSPVYQAACIVPELASQIVKSLDEIGLPYEVILVDDGSLDHSWEVIEEQCRRYKRVKGIKLSRNFGQHIAITAGLEISRGRWVVVMDCDLQDDPREIPKLYEAALAGYHVVLAQRVQRLDSYLKRLSSSLFYWIFGYLTGTRQDSSVANFGIYSKPVIDAVISMGDSVRWFPLMVQWVGFSMTKVPVNHGRRYVGESTYNLKRLIGLAANNIIAFSDKPLRLSVLAGFACAIFSFLLGIAYLLIAILGGIKVSGFATLAISIFFSTGTIVFVLGLVGLYVGKSFDKIKNRPLYIVETMRGWSSLDKN